ncbi:hypothetical protein RSAG8_08362, partial [Rhizoctonia solani AG-8 WAC10335]
MTLSHKIYWMWGKYPKYSMRGSNNQRGGFCLDLRHFGHLADPRLETRGRIPAVENLIRPS